MLKDTMRITREDKILADFKELKESTKDLMILALQNIRQTKYRILQRNIRLYREQKSALIKIYNKEVKEIDAEIKKVRDDR